MQSNIPNAMTGEYPLSLEELVAIINEHKEKAQKETSNVQRIQFEIRDVSVTINEWEDIKSKIPTWQNVFLNADVETKRVLVNRLIERIDIKKEEIVIRFKINLNDFFPKPRNSDGFGVPEQRIWLYHHDFDRLRSEICIWKEYFSKHFGRRG